MTFTEAIGIVLGSGVLAAVFSESMRKSSERYEKLYGPLKYNLLMMKLTRENQDQVMEDIKGYASVELRLALMDKHLSPLTIKWIEHRDKIKELFEKNPGFIREEDFVQVADFLDGCLKRDITENGQNLLATNEQRTQKLLDSVDQLQKKYIGKDY